MASNNQPTDKQINYINILSGGSSYSNAMWEIAKDMGVQPSKAARRATSADASRTIARLLKEEKEASK